LVGSVQHQVFDEISARLGPRERSSAVMTIIYATVHRPTIEIAPEAVYV